MQNANIAWGWPPYGKLRFTFYALRFTPTVISPHAMQTQILMHKSLLPNAVIRWLAMHVKITFYEMGITCHLAAPKGQNGKAKGNALENKHAPPISQGAV